MEAPGDIVEVKTEPSSEIDEDKQEREHFIRILNAFKYYRAYSVRRVTEAEKHYKALPQHHRDMIPHFTDHLNQLRGDNVIEEPSSVSSLVCSVLAQGALDGSLQDIDAYSWVTHRQIKRCIGHNCEIIGAIIEDAESLFENKVPEDFSEENENEPKYVVPLVSDMDKVKTTLKQFVRDWSEDGRQERKACYDPVIEEIEKRFPTDKGDPSSVCVLVPGAGLGRLAFELARRGYSCQGNEWSLFMLLSSNFVLNKCQEVNSFTLYPWIHQWTNNMRSDNQVEAVRFPDISPADLPLGANFSMAAGDFLEVYNEQEAWDCVATVFFIDTAHNIIAYVEAIYKILKPGGYWANLGPLLYHYSDVPNEMSIELSYEDVKNVIQKVGFVFEKEEKKVKSSYTQNPRSMLNYTYDSVFFVVKKPS